MAQSFRPRTMVDSLLLVIYPYQGRILRSFCCITDYWAPNVYTGNAAVAEISSSFNETTHELLFRCENCFEWDYNGDSDGVKTSEKTGVVLGRAHAKETPENAACPHIMTLGFHGMGRSRFGSGIADLASSLYAGWAALAKPPVPSSTSIFGQEGRR
ncbi:hypothetical protein B0T14DRAFT_560560 [Immersiella caudata]|uniref:Cellobiose dehydrogenase-like cytochrome domain-containing protein n=1 Tax=Immersiella caudata TaxID=314043 RepID=A0AA40CD08_9PEZI|nr:hypothetical protein B0T14DRAFT_560560 [Immersiella caudata]